MGIFNRRMSDFEHWVAEYLCQLVNEGLCTITWDREQNDYIFELSEAGKERLEELEKMEELGVVTDGTEL